MSPLVRLQAINAGSPDVHINLQYKKWTFYVLLFTFYVVVVLDDPGRVPRRTSVPGETAILSSIFIRPGRVPQQCVVVCPLGTACTAV